MIVKRLYIGINPEPWTAPEASVSRSAGRAVPRLHKSARLRAYQEAIGEHISCDYPQLEPIDEPLELDFYFWRDLESYKIKGKNRRRNRADATNLQKALEDALQKYLFTNDRLVRRVQSTLVEQAPDIEPGIVVVMAYGFCDIDFIPRSISEFVRLHRGQEGVFFDEGSSPTGELLCH